MDFDVALPELGTEALQQLDLLVGQLQLPFPGRLFEPEQPFVLRGEAMPAPHAPYAS